MADREISELTAADTLDGDEIVHISQGGNSRKATLLDIVGLSTGAMLTATYDPNADGIIAVAQGGTNAATAAGARTNLGLGTMAVQNAASVSISGGTVTGITDIAVADGGTGASDASGARTNLGLAIGTDVQAYSANLDGFAATTVTNVQNRVNHTGTQLAATISDFSTAADARVSAAIGSTVQAYSALLDSVSDLSLTAGDIVYATGAAAVSRLPIGGEGQVLAVSGGVPAWGTELVVGGLLASNNLSDVANATTARTNIGAQASSANLTTLAGMTTGTARDAVGRFDTVANAEAATLAVTPEFIEIAGYNSADDLGGAAYGNPVTVDPGKTDQIAVDVNGTTTYYNRLHKVGEVDCAKHGMFLDGREETSLFEDACAVALDRGLDRIVMPGGKSVEIVGATLPEAALQFDLRGSTLLGNFNDSVAGATDKVLVFDMMRGTGTSIGNMTENGGLAAAFDGGKVETAATSAGRTAANGYAGKTWTTPRRIFRATVYGSSDAGYCTGANPTATLDLYGKSTPGAPSSDTDGTLLATLSFTDTNNESATPRELVSSNQSTGYYHAWVRVSRPSGTGVRISEITFDGASGYDLTLQNFVINGQYNNAVTLLAERTGLEIRGYRNVRLLEGKMTGFARGGTTPDIIFDRDVHHTRIHDCLRVLVDGYIQDANAAGEEIVVSCSDPITQYLIRRVQTINKISSGSSVSVYNCGPGRVTQNYVQSTTGSCFNLLTRYVECDHNDVLSSASHAIDLSEGLIYSHGSWVHHNIIRGAQDAAINGCGNGLRIEDNVATGSCAYGVNVQSALNGTTTYGSWYDLTEHDISGIQIKGNRNTSGHNAQSLSTNANVRLVGDGASAEIQAEIVVADEAHPSTKTEYGIDLDNVSRVKISGRLMHGQDGLIRISDNCGTITLEDLVTEPEVGQGVNHVVLVSGTTQKLIANRWTPVGALDASHYYIARVSAGTFTEIQLNDSPLVGATPSTEISVPANTRILRDGKIYVAPTPFTITGTLDNATDAGGGRLTGTLAVSGVRLGTDEVLNCTSVTTNAVIASAYVSADNEITIVYRNTSATDITNPSCNLRILIGPRGYSV